MKKFFRFSVLSLLLLVGNMVYAQDEKVITFDFSKNEGCNFPTEATALTTPFTMNGYTFTPKEGNYSYRAYEGESDGCAQMEKCVLWLPKFDDKVTSVEITSGTKSPRSATAKVVATLADGTELGSLSGSIPNKGGTKVFSTAEYKDKATGYYISTTQTIQVGSIKVHLEATTDGIKNVTSADKKNDVIYTLDGRRVVNPTYKGVYIVNGKKVILK